MLARGSRPPGLTVAAEREVLVLTVADRPDELARITRKLAEGA